MLWICPTFTKRGKWQESVEILHWQLSSSKASSVFESKAPPLRKPWIKSLLCSDAYSLKRLANSALLKIAASHRLLQRSAVKFSIFENFFFVLSQATHPRSAANVGRPPAMTLDAMQPKLGRNSPRLGPCPHWQSKKEKNKKTQKTNH